MLHRERRQLQGEEEEEEEQAHSGCQPVSPRLHETLMDLIDWWEHQGVWAELSADWAPVLGGKINLADTSRARSAPHRASIQQLWLIEEQSKVRLCLRINMPCVAAVILRNASDHGGYNMASQLISCQSINKEIWKDIHRFRTLIDMENVYVPQERLEASHECTGNNQSLPDILFMPYKDRNIKLEIFLSLHIYIYSVTGPIRMIIYRDKTIYHLYHTECACLAWCYLAGVLISQSKCCL